MRKSRLIFRISFIMIFLLLFANFQVFADPVTRVTSITLNKTTDTITVDSTDTLTATVNPGNATYKQVVWTTSNPNVVTVNNGTIKGVSKGVASIIATTIDGNLSASCFVTVNDPKITIEFYRTTATLTVGATDYMTATVRKMGTSQTTTINQPVTYTSSNNAVVQVNASGTITAIAQGSATITAATAGATNIATCTVTVTSRSNTNISLDKTSDLIYVGGTDTIKATLNSSDLSNSSVTWSSSNPSIVSVSSSGVLTGVGPGSATVTVTAKTSYGTSSASCFVTVSYMGGGTTPTQGFAISKRMDNVEVGKTDTLAASLNSTIIPNANVKWESINKDIASVANGVIMGIAPGITTITATEPGGGSAACIVTVYAQGQLPITSITLNKTSDNLLVGASDVLISTLNPIGIANWTSSDPSIVTVSYGVLRGIKPGAATITATTPDGTSSASCTVIVYPQDSIIPVQTITLNKNSDTLMIGATDTLTSTLFPTNATNFSLVWTSSDNSVATVSDGKITAIKSGTAVITAATFDRTVSAICNVTVTGTSNGTDTGGTDPGTSIYRRLGGKDRYETSVAISKAGWNGTSEYAVLASGGDFPDGLSAATLAKKYNAPILLTSRDSIPGGVLSELARLRVNHVLITGGIGVISQEVENQLIKMGMTTERFGGKDRFETSVKIAKKLGNTSGEIIIANGYEWTDALSVSPIAAKKGFQ
ncbi:Ig-like domain-containing protein [Clostridium sp. OS1-26]|uniref:Ig-like domain-containing protein n=1 Tax=Clostridium sp. OS1-26 TaxID=3070681 RepID=UPI0027E02A9F|nr:Ig-like domain-containing protein [Clostridium sp. OS1-26]WML36114.1 Ig-like domain-containing protein [Clostridium sp. OS1-26]